MQDIFIRAENENNVRLEVINFNIELPIT